MHMIEDIVKLLMLSISEGYYFAPILVVQKANGITKKQDSWHANSEREIVEGKLKLKVSLITNPN